VNNNDDARNVNEKSENATNGATTPDTGADEATGLPLARLDALGMNTIIDESEVARLFGRCRKSVKRSVARGELPPPVRTFGQDTWLVACIAEHMRARLAAATRDAERLRRRPV